MLVLVLGELVGEDDEFLGGSGEGHVELAGVLGDEIFTFVGEELGGGFLADEGVGSEEEDDGGL